MKQKINYYIVPKIININSGPGVRTSEFRKSLIDHEVDFFEISNSDKIKNSMRAYKNTITYVESSTNRVGFSDIISLLIIRFIKKNDIYIYIRDVYPFIFPEEYKTIRTRITSFAYKLTSMFYVKIAKRLLFPTTEMGDIFNSKLALKSVNTGVFPPGINCVKNADLSSSSSKNLLHVGGFEYKHSGAYELLYIISLLPCEFSLHIVTRDASFLKSLPIWESVKERVYIHKFNKLEWIEYFSEVKVLCALHSRPRNCYDDITYPIKIMDYISLGVPFLSLKHKPLISILHDKSLLLSEDIDKLILNTHFIS